MARVSASLLLAVVAVSLVAGYYWWLSSRPLSLTVVVPVGWLRGRYVAGFVQAVASAPTGFVERTVFVDLQRGGAATVSLRLPVDRLPQALRPRSGDLAAVHVNLYLYTQNGSLCVSAATIDTLHYTYRLMGTNEKAWKAAIQEPDLLLRAGTVTMPRELFTPCIPVGRVLHKLTEPIVEEALRTGKPHHPPALPDAPSLPPGTLTIIINKALYDARNSPPQAWLNKVEPPGEGRHLWWMFATLYSQALLIPKDRATLGYAIFLAAQWYHLIRGWETSRDKTTVYGVVTMNDLVNALEDYMVPLLGWRDTYPPGTVIRHFDSAPLIEIRATCPTCSGNSYPLVEATMAAAKYGSIQAGVSLLGVIVLPVSKASLRLNAAPLVARLTNKLDDRAIYAPMDDVYLHDGALILLDVRSTSFNGRDYWMFVPIVNPLPIHYYRFNYDRMEPGDVNAAGVKEALNYMLSQPTPSSGYITPEEVNVNHTYLYDDFSSDIPLDSFNIPSSYSNTLAAFIAYCANVALWAAAAKYIPSPYTLVVDAASILISLTYADAHAAKAIFKMYLVSGHTGHILEIDVKKYTQRYISDNVLPPGLRPTLVVYSVEGRDWG